MIWGITYHFLFSSNYVDENKLFKTETESRSYGRGGGGGKKVNFFLEMPKPSEGEVDINIFQCVFRIFESIFFNKFRVFWGELFEFAKSLMFCEIMFSSSYLIFKWFFEFPQSTLLVIPIPTICSSIETKSLDQSEALIESRAFIKLSDDTQPSSHFH